MGASSGSFAPTATACRTEHSSWWCLARPPQQDNNTTTTGTSTLQGRFQNFDSKPTYTNHHHQHGYNTLHDSNHDGSVAVVSDSWSLKRLLSRHGKRRYRVLEQREPNRLRKRMA